MRQDRRFGLDTPLTPPAPARLGHRRLVGVAVAVVLLAAAGGIWASIAASDGPHGYRTATVTRQDVAETLQQTGTIEPVAQASVAFPTSGTVKAVAVAAGDTVAVGQTLATLDTTTLQANLLKANASLAQAKLTLQRALNGESTTDTGSDGSAPAANAGGGAGGQGATGTVDAEAAGIAQAASLNAPPSGTTGGSSTDASGGAGTGAPGATSAGTSSSQLRADQQAVLDAQKSVDQKLQAAKAAMAQVSAACTGGAGTSNPPAGGSSGTSSPGSTPTSTSTSTTTPAGTADAVCKQTLQVALAAEQALATAQEHLASAAATLTTALGDTAGQRGAGGTGGESSAGVGSGSGTVRPSSSGSARSTTLVGATSSAPTAQDLITDQASVDGAQLQVEVAQQALAQATLTSPISGTIAQVDLAAGQQVSAASSSATIAVVGGGDSYEVATTVTVDQLAHLTKGASATVAPDGTATTLHATVVSIGVAPSTGSTTTYPVVLGITDTPSGLRSGTTAAVTIVLSSSSATLAVPTSAVQAFGGRKTVTVLKDGTATPTVVTTGAVGAAYTAITSGLKLGQTVVLADLGEPLPTSANGTANRTGSGSFARFGGGLPSFGGGGGFAGRGRGG